MEDYIDHYFSASSWSDMNLIERSSWLHSAPNLQPPNHVGDSPASMIDSTLSLDGLATEDATFHVPVGAAGSAIDHGLISGEAGCYIDGSKGASNGNVMFTSMNLQSANAIGKDFGDLALSHSFGETGYIEIADPKSCEFGGHLSQFETFSPLQQACLPFQSCDDIASLPCLIGQRFDENDGNINRYADIDRIVKPEKLRTSVAEGNQELQNYILPSVAAEDRITNEMIGLASHSQKCVKRVQRDSPTPNSNSSGITKPRVRARRGQATDPHSIAERLRRERIAERMKNLQELVPNSRKTDKASMLDEIIEYVKFLQMQVKVLSMSRSGAKGAVVPLITDGQAEVLNNPFPASADETAFEQEVLELMESSVTKAMQYLQTKGLCLMPISLATAISKRNATTKSDGKIPEYVHNNSGSSSSDSNSSSDSLAAGVRTNHFFGDEITVMGGKIEREG